MTHLDTIKFDLEALKTAHDANAAARLATLEAKDAVLAVTLARETTVLEAKAAETVAHTAEAVSAALLATGFERLRASIDAYSEQAAIDQRTVEFSNNTTLADFAQQARLDAGGQAVPARDPRFTQNNPGNPNYPAGTQNPNFPNQNNPNLPNNPNFPYNPGNPNNTNFPGNPDPNPTQNPSPSPEARVAAEKAEAVRRSRTNG